VAIAALWPDEVLPFRYGIISCCLKVSGYPVRSAFSENTSLQVEVLEKAGAPSPLIEGGYGEAEGGSLFRTQKIKSPFVTV